MSRHMKSIRCPALHAAMNTASLALAAVEIVWIAVVADLS